MAYAVPGGTASGSNNEKVADATLTLTVTADVDDLVVIGMTCDNTGTSTPTISSISVPGGESAAWTECASIPSVTATSGAGVRGFIYAIQPTTTWTAQTITITLSATSTAKAAAWQRFTGGILTARGNAFPFTGAANASSATSTVAGVGAGELAVGLLITEANAAPADDADTTRGTWTGLGVTTTGGGSAANAALNLQYKIVTGTGDQTINGTVSDGGAAAVAFRLAQELTATTVSTSRIDLAWEAAPRATSYNLEWSADGATGWTSLQNTSARTYSHTGLTAATAYYYRVTSNTSVVTTASGYSYATVPFTDTFGSGTVMDPAYWEQESADNGSGTTTASTSVTGGTAVFSTGASGHDPKVRAHLASNSAAQGALMKVTGWPDTTGSYLMHAQLRTDDTWSVNYWEVSGTCYLFTAVSDGTNANRVRIGRKDNPLNTETNVAIVDDLASAGGRTTAAWWWRVEAEGSNPVVLRTRRWLDGESEPGTWDTTYSDSAGTRRTSGRPFALVVELGASQQLSFDSIQIYDPSVVVIGGTAALSGSGTLTLAGVPALTGATLALAGPGALTGTAVQVAVSGPVTLAGAGTLSLVGEVPSDFLAPENLTATPVSSTQINLAWDPVATATGYDIERDSVIVVQNQAATSYADTGRSPGTSYSYRVRAVK